jgi:hypothetical protein
MLATVFYCRQDAGCRYPAPSSSNQHWAEPYYRSAVSNGTDLPMRRTHAVLTLFRATKVLQSTLKLCEECCDKASGTPTGKWSIESNSHRQISTVGNRRTIIWLSPMLIRRRWSRVPTSSVLSTIEHRSQHLERLSVRHYP